MKKLEILWKKFASLNLEKAGFKIRKRLYLIDLYGLCLCTPHKTLNSAHQQNGIYMVNYSLMCFIRILFSLSVPLSRHFFKLSTAREPIAFNLSSSFVWSSYILLSRNCVPRKRKEAIVVSWLTILDDCFLNILLYITQISLFVI